ncbi:Capsule assembly protein Wzi [Reichenbachiella faecimaris]|uniref:Capsule assembly protein Wzi n=1 Tax=Reichenbachiella faecimaris TaxID=692418 RepID=A0A1W2GM70_REIFA|nr:capsule assembly Wzi family protein [Reichenbachiella faecimaris]SMD37747.1 Capsule assembly protein Wzi [Reichenbachiella faecimaris]
MKKSTLLIVSSLLFLSLINSALAQVLYPGDYTENYYRTLQLKNPELLPKPIMIRPSIIEPYSSDRSLNWNLWEGNFKTKFKEDSNNNFYILNPRISYVYNHKYPRGYNNGAVWSGRGSNTSLTAGFGGNIGILHYTFAPIVWYAQNREYNIPSSQYNKNPYSYPAEGKIDWVMRYGDDSYSDFDWGQSEIRIIYKNVTLGFSTANFSWGPSRYNPIIMSKNAAGFPHIDLGTARPAKTKIGLMEFKWYWGAMYESDYFDDNSENDRKYITGFTLGYQPSFVKGLSLGVNRIMYTRWADGDLVTEDFFNAFVRNTHKGFMKNDEYDQMFSLVMEYAFPNVGLNLYVEWARNDFFGSIMDLAEHPDRTRAITIGLTKTFDLDNGNLLEINYEKTTLSSNQIQISSPGISATYYVHGVVDNGYTNNGQIVGAGIGPGSNSDIFWVNLYNPNGKMGFTFQRIRFNDDYLVNAYAGVQDEPTDYEITIGTDYLRMFNNFSINPEFLLIYRNNLLFEDNEQNNFVFNLSVSYFLNR